MGQRIAGIDLGALPRDPAPPDAWQDQAACHGLNPDLFFPVSEDDAAPALAYCAGCPQRVECLAWAIRNGERYGIWGGLTEQQRRRIARVVA